MSKLRVIAIYLPQFHPIPENDKWWGKGFTEWTNVAKARPLYHGHYQPKIPTELGFYDLRLPEVRKEQAKLAKDTGIEGFCYWHYWFGNGKELLEKPFDEVLKSGEPDFPFCLGWANHSWYKKTWEKNGNDELLIEQKYPGEQDAIDHFNKCLPAFLDNRYIRIDDKPVFLIWSPKDSEEIRSIIKIWNNQAAKNGIKGIYFIGFTYSFLDIDYIKSIGFDDVLYDPIIDTRKQCISLFRRLLTRIFSRPTIIPYNAYSKYAISKFQTNKAIPCILPNFDHTPRSGRRGIILESTPKKFQKLLENTISLSNTNKEKIVFIKSWNEWGEGNYLEPDEKYGRSYLEAVKNVLMKN